MRPRLFLVDAHGLAYRSLYALIDRPLRTSRGESTSVAWGVTQFLRKLLAEHSPEYIAFVFDATRGKSFRHTLYPEYKATRLRWAEDEREDFARAMQRMRALLEAFRISMLAVEGFEADDVIATLATTAVQRGVDVVIVSGDTDFYQLVGPEIRVLEPGRGGRALISPEWIDAARAEERFGVPPSQVRDYLALTGDTSDNVPGIPGIGHKTAVALLERFGTLEEILAHLEEVEPARAKRAISEHAEQARLAKTLVTVLTDVSVELDLPALARQEADQTRLRELFVELEFRTLLKEVAGEETSGVEVTRLTSEADAEAFAARARARGKVAIDSIAADAASRSHRTGLRGLGLAIDPGSGSELSEIAGPIAELLADPSVLKIGHDLARMQLILQSAGVELRGPMMDVMIAAFLVEGGPRPRNLETQVVEAFGQAIALDAGPAARAEAILRLHQKLDPELDLRGHRASFEAIDMPLVRVLAGMQRAGILIDRAFFDALEARMIEASKRLEAALYSEAGGPLNLESPAQLKKVLFEKLGLPVKKRTKTGPSADAEVIAELAAEGHAFPRRLLERREIERVLSSFVRAIPALADPETGRIHPIFGQASPGGRITSADPSFDALRLHPSFFDELRAGFVTPPGRQLLSARYKDLEHAMSSRFLDVDPVAFAREHGYVETLYRRRAIPELASTNPRIRAQGEELAKKLPIEISAGDVLKKAMIALEARLRERTPLARIVAQAGDEILLEVEYADAGSVEALARSAMRQAEKLDVEIEIGTGRTWQQARTSHQVA